MLELSVGIIILLLQLLKALVEVFVPIYLAVAAWKIAKEYEYRGAHERGEIEPSKPSFLSRVFTALRNEFYKK